MEISHSSHLKNCLEVIRIIDMVSDFKVIYRKPFRSKIVPIRVAISKAKKFFYKEFRKMHDTYGSLFDSQISKKSWGTKITELVSEVSNYVDKGFVAKISMSLEYVQIKDRYAIIVRDLSITLYQLIKTIAF